MIAQSGSVRFKFRIDCVRIALASGSLEWLCEIVNKSLPWRPKYIKFIFSSLALSLPLSLDAFSKIHSNLHKKLFKHGILLSEMNGEYSDLSLEKREICGWMACVCIWIQYILICCWNFNERLNRRRANKCSYCVDDRHVKWHFNQMLNRFAEMNENRDHHRNDNTISI